MLFYCMHGYRTQRLPNEHNCCGRSKQPQHTLMSEGVEILKFTGMQQRMNVSYKSTNDVYAYMGNEFDNGEYPIDHLLFSKIKYKEVVGKSNNECSSFCLSRNVWNTAQNIFDCRGFWSLRWNLRIL
ncbi:hypothetical protein CHS0354_042004 [Potamilus streckersoni]|uniref:Uncharacterized protein n=1 Tax=Potamilus streckersoni TaxID=2493646 RepID=A0AAE0T9S6_9BIVA|nr:hypothetical protein CHS0354_042004 [Potamilus streckersoni]